ncbi:unnamed protein product [Calypogeia fissa]
MAEQIRTLRPCSEVLADPVPYASPNVVVPKLTGTGLRAFVWAAENSVIGPPLFANILKNNKTHEIISYPVIPDVPMYFPEYPADKVTELEVRCVEEDSHPATRVGLALENLPVPIASFQDKLSSDYPYLYWTIRDYAHAYKTGHITPSEVAERFISAIEDSEKRSPPMKFLISFKPQDIRTQAAASTKRHASGSTLSILDGVLFAVKDDIDCCPHPSTAGTKWLHKVRDVKEDAACVSRLRRAGVVLVGKTNMNELGLGVQGQNMHYGTVRNPHDTDRHTGGSSSGSCALVAAGLCSGALGTDVGGSVRIPSGICGTLGLKVTVGRTTLGGVSTVGWTMESVGPIAANVEDLVLIYAAFLGSVPTDILHSRPLPPCVPILKADGLSVMSQLKIGKYSPWLNDVLTPDIAKACERSLEILHEKHGTEIKEIVLPEIDELRTAHMFTVGTEYMTTLSPYYSSVKKQMGHEARANLALFKSFSSSDYVAAQQLKRRAMYYYMEAFKSVDVVVTPTTAMTAPPINAASLKVGESDLDKTASLMRFVLQGNLLGLPCLSVPVGHDSNGLPIGLQLIGRPWEEATLLRVASAIEDLTSSLRKRPKVFYDLLR